MDTTFEKYITSLENVQRRAARLVAGFYRMSYSKRLRKIESTIVGLQESWRRYDRDFQTFPLLRKLYST